MERSGQEWESLSGTLIKGATIDDPRLESPQCKYLAPVKTVHSNPWFTVRSRGGYFTVEHRGPQVIILPIIDDRYILMVRVKRPVIVDDPLELPAGSANKNEMPIQAAARELGEETGIKIHDLERFTLLPPLSNSPNRDPKLLHVFAIHISQKEYGKRACHDQEIQSVECLRIEEVVKKIVNGEIYVSVPIAVITTYVLSKHYNATRMNAM